MLIKNASPSSRLTTSNSRKYLKPVTIGLPPGVMIVQLIAGPMPNTCPSNPQFFRPAGISSNLIVPIAVHADAERVGGHVHCAKFGVELGAGLVTRFKVLAIEGEAGRT